MNRLAIAVVMACFNRREKTLRCLASLFAQQGVDADFSVHLLDDASTDGTAAAVAERFPGVRILTGDGQHYWGGGMHAAMRSAITEPLDYMLWLNDDVELDRDAVARLLETERQQAGSSNGLDVIIGAMRDPVNGKITYSGFCRRNTWHPAQLDRVEPYADRARECDTMNGNCVLVPRKMIDTIGLIDPIFIHQLGDIDYGYRIRKAGGRIWLAAGSVGVCAGNANHTTATATDMFTKLKFLHSPLRFNPKSNFAFYSKHSTILGIPLFFVSYLSSVRRAIIE